MKSVSYPRLNATRAAILSLVVGMACGYMGDPPLPPDAKPFVPPAVYTRWWAMVESCSGVERPLDKVQWYAVPGTLRDPHSGDVIEGYHSFQCR